jgi:chorismate mutase
MTEQEAREALAEHRRRIDDVDRRLVAVLNERTRIVHEIGRIKAAAHMPIYEPRREDEVFANAIASNAGPLPHDAVKRVFERIVDEMRVVQKTRMEQESQC